MPGESNISPALVEFKFAKDRYLHWIRSPAHGSLFVRRDVQRAVEDIETYLEDVEPVDVYEDLVDSSYTLLALYLETLRLVDLYETENRPHVG